MSINKEALAHAGPFHAGPSRRKAVAQEEDAAKLQFGDGEALTPGEVQTILGIARSAPGVPPAPDNKTYKLTLEHVAQFANADPHVAETMRKCAAEYLARPSFLNNFEVAQIMYLRPEKVDVAVALIPSLERYAQGDEAEETLQQLLDEVRAMARYGTGI